MPLQKNDPFYDTAQFFRRTEKMFRTSTAAELKNSITTPEQVRNLLKKKPPSEASEQAMGRYRKQILRFERKWEQLPYPIQAIRFGAGMFKALMQEEGNRSLREASKIKDDKRIHEIITEPRRTSNRKALRDRNTVSLLVTNDPEKSVGFEELKGKHEYRDPARQRSGDPIHHGARARRFKRYAITEIEISGKKYSAGRKGTKYEGLGLEPPLMRGRSRAVSNKKKYKAFKRIGYPGRSRPDIITNEISFPLHYEILQIKEVRDRIINQCVSVVRGVYQDYQKGTIQVVGQSVKEHSEQVVKEWNL